MKKAMASKTNIKEEMFDAIQFNGLSIQDLLEITCDIIAEYSDYIETEAQDELQKATAHIVLARDNIDKADQLA